MIARLPKRRPSKAKLVRGHRRPEVESLEGRRLMSYGGSPDFSFGVQGYVHYGLPVAASSFTGVSSLVEPDGKLLVFGNLQIFNDTSTGSHVAVARYNADGSLDSTFGGGGYFTDPTLSTTGGSPYDTAADEGVLEAKGDIVLTANILDVAKVVRLSPNGTLDPSFGVGGIVTLGTVASGATVDSKIDSVDWVATLPGGQIAVGGSSKSGSFLFPAVTRLNTDGSVDPTYGTAGLVLAPIPAGLAGYLGDTGYPGEASNTAGMVAEPDGRVVILGNADSDTSSGVPVATRFTTTGALDPSFGINGQQAILPSTVYPAAKANTANALAIQPDGKLVIGGSTYYGTNTNLGGAPVVLRLDSNGPLDPTFGIGGANILVHSGLAPNALTVQPDGKILTSTLVRLLADGLPDPTFGEGGIASFPTYVTGQLFTALADIHVLADGKLIGVQKTGGVQVNGGIIRFLPYGSASDFNGDGVSDPAVLNVAVSGVSYLPSGGGPVVTTLIGDSGPALTLPAVGAYDGGGISEIAVYRPGLGAFDVKPFTGGPDVVTPFGTPGIDQTYPAPGDYYASGSTEIAVYEPAQGAFYVRGSFGNPTVAVPLGTPGIGQSIPAEADYYGTGQDDFAVYLVAQGAFEIHNPVTGLNDTIPFGTPGAGQSIPVPGDYDGSGQAELAVYVPASGDLIYRSLKTGTDVVIPFGIAGIATTLPAPGDYDGSGKTEVAGYLPTQGNFEYLPAAGGPAVLVPLGTANDSLAYSQGTNSVAESGIGPPAGAPSVRAESVEVPLTSDVLDILAGTTLKKKAATS